MDRNLGLEKWFVSTAVNNMVDGLLAAIRSLHVEVLNSMLFAVTAIFEGEPSVNSPSQKMCMSRPIALAERSPGTVIGSDDLKSEHYAEIMLDMNDSADNPLSAIRALHADISPSSLFAVGAILEVEPFANGPPQTMFVLGSFQALA